MPPVDSAYQIYWTHLGHSLDAPWTHLGRTIAIDKCASKKINYISLSTSRMTSKAINFGSNLRHIGDELYEVQRRRRRNRIIDAQITTLLFQICSFYYVFLNLMVNAPRFIFKILIKLSRFAFPKPSWRHSIPKCEKSRKKSANSTIRFGTSYNRQGLRKSLICYWKVN